MNVSVVCSKCGRPYTSAYHPPRGARCPFCRKTQILSPRALREATTDPVRPGLPLGIAAMRSARS
ncbi:hypothetical protein ISS40_07910 [Candidatus Bathyarchaeota archaeon]|nr:hypothetical protein [Candidatus Bathyarchaeota archaeon]